MAQEFWMSWVIILMLCIVASISDAAGPYAATTTSATQPAAFISTVHRKQVPHTDRTGHILQTFDREKSFFPIGLWGQVLPDSAGGPYPDWKELAAAGFNTVWPLNWDDRASALAAEAKLQLVFMGAIDAAHATKLKNHPNLLGNMWQDEPTGKLNIPGFNMPGLFDEFLAYKKRVNAAMPGLPVFINDPPAIFPGGHFKEWWMKWNAAGDVSCQDDYPIVDRTARTRTLAPAPTGIPQVVHLAVDINAGTKPVWTILAAFDSPADPNWPFRMPTPVQLRSEIYGSIVSGATGVAYFIMDSNGSRRGGCVGMSPRPKTRYGPGEAAIATPAEMVQSKALWEMSRQINAELKELTPALLSPTVGDDVQYRVSVKGQAVTPTPLHCMMKRDSTGALVLLTVNMDDAVLSATVNMAAAISSIEALFENRTAPSAGTSGADFTDRFEPFETHVYRMRLKDVPLTRPTP